VSSPYEEDWSSSGLVPQGELTPKLYKLQWATSYTAEKSPRRIHLICSGRTNHLLLATVTGLAPFNELHKNAL
jgi:hypothetical protein